MRQERKKWRQCSRREKCGSFHLWLHLKVKQKTFLDRHLKLITKKWNINNERPAFPESSHCVCKESTKGKQVDTRNLSVLHTSIDLGEFGMHENCKTASWGNEKEVRHGFWCLESFHQMEDLLLCLFLKFLMANRKRGGVRKVGGGDQGWQSMKHVPVSSFLDSISDCLSIRLLCRHSGRKPEEMFLNRQC